MRFQAFPRRTALLVLAAATLVLAAAAGVVYGLPALRAAQAQAALMARVQARQDAKDAYASVQRAIEGRKKDPKNSAWYVQEGNSWLLIADLLEDHAARQDAIDAYERGIAVFGQSNSLLMSDDANAYREDGRYADAERMYRAAIAAAPTDSLAYEQLTDLYRVQMKKPPEEILPVFQQALSSVTDNARIVEVLADYLVSIGRDKDALQYYELLQKKYPGQFDKVIVEIEKRLGVK